MLFNSDFLVIYIRAVQGCNLNCSHCFTNGNKDPIKFADLKDIEIYLQAIYTNIKPDKVVIYIHGGETFLAPLQYLSEINSIIYSIFLNTKVIIVPQTNLLVTVNDKFLSFLHDEYAGEIGVSWDYGIRFNNNVKSLSEKRFLSNLDQLTNNNINVAVAITVQKHLLKYKPLELVQLFKKVKSIDFELLTIFNQTTKDLKVSNIEWSEFLLTLVKYYITNDTAWSLPQVDLFTKSIKENKFYRCKCDCCNNRTFTMNPNGTVGLCPDTAYYQPFSTAQKMLENWSLFEEQAGYIVAKREASKINPLCLKCEYYTICGGNCEDSLFVEGEDECPLSKRVIKYQVNNIELFSKKLNYAYQNLSELKKESN